jgi:hypothetical protein
MKNVIHFAHVERLADVFIYKIESGIARKVVNIRPPAGQQVVDADHTPAFTEQGIAKMRSKETGATGHQRAL